MNREAQKYFDVVADDRKAILLAIRKLLLNHKRGLTETMAYKLPCYELDGDVVFAIGSQKHYMSFYVFYHDLLVVLESFLSKYNCGKSCIRFKSKDDNIKEDLEVVMAHVLEKRKESKYYGKTSPKD